MLLRGLYHPKFAMNVSTSMEMRRKKSSGTTHQATKMMT